MILDEWQELIKVKKIDIVVLDMPLLNTMKYKDLDGIESLISDLILQLLSYISHFDPPIDFLPIYGSITIISC